MADVRAIVIEEPRIEFLEGGHQGEPGPPGTPGAGAGTGELIRAYPAGAALSALRVVRLDEDGRLRYASHAVAADAHRLLGITRQAGAEDAEIEVLLYGRHHDASWDWTPGVVYLGADGQMTQDVPGSGFLVVVAEVLRPRELKVVMRGPIWLA